MNEIIKWAMTVLIVTMVIGAMPTDAEGEIYDDTLRLHILANSDQSEDQKLKLEIRDRILLKYGKMLKGGESITEAKESVEQLLPEIEGDARVWIGELGYNYDVKASLSVEWYETREYEDFTLPAGYYSSLRIIIGEGKGQNWWCVMYPPLCMEMASESAPRDDGVIDYSKEEIRLITSGKYQVKFKILEELSRAFEKNS
jgi:stage II sporulation protein R